MITSLRIKPYAIQSAELATIENISVNIELAKARVGVALRSAQGDLLKTVYVDIAGDDYENWKSDDKYIVIKAMNQLGIDIIGEAAQIIEAPQVPEAGSATIIEAPATDGGSAAIIEAPQVPVTEVVTDEVTKESSDEVAKESSDEVTEETSDESADINEPKDGKQKVKKRN